MCGIGGVWFRRGDQRAEKLSDLLRTFNKLLKHRGPDGSGLWVEPDEGLGLSHSRLSIVDLDVSGNQPMVSACGRYVIVFNGEIYNYWKLKLLPIFRGRKWSGSGDTVVFVALVSELGLLKALDQVDGMFAFALWDKAQRKMYLGRDRFGEKPLFFRCADDFLIFASELRPLLETKMFKAELDSQAHKLYSHLGYVPGSMSILSGVKKILPGEVVCFDRCGSLRAKHTFYWTTEKLRRSSLNNVSTRVEIETSLMTSVEDRLKADVPVGCFLSGGTDSSLVCAIASKVSGRGVSSFTLRSSDERFDEGGEAAAVATYLGLDHHELTVSGDLGLELIDQLPKIYDEPFADYSQIPTFFISQFSRQLGFKVMLSGDGADEIFGGYNRHVWLPKIARHLTPASLPARRLISSVIKSLPSAKWNVFFLILSALLPRRLRFKDFARHIHKLARLLAAADIHECYLLAISQCAPDTGLERGSLAELGSKYQLDNEPGADLCEMMMLADISTYLPDDILVKVDRASMANGQEIRSPFLCHSLAEKVWSMPISDRVDSSSGKKILKHLLSKSLPKGLFDRPKQGFGIPMDEWLRTHLTDLIEDHLSEKSLKHSFYESEMKLLRSKLKSHRQGKEDHTGYLWSRLMFQMWIKNVGI